MVPLMNLIHYEAIVKQVKRNVSQHYASQNIISSGFPHEVLEKVSNLSGKVFLGHIVKLQSNLAASVSAPPPPQPLDLLT
jgi:hypothetical protein